MINFEPKQRQIIDFDKGNMVVSASAGSGKTTVMINRIINLIVHEKAEIGEILAVTFTKMASKEISARIAEALWAEIKNGNCDRARLKRQLDDLSMASISTVHGFCSNLIKTYFYVADVDPKFAIASESQSAELKQNAINEVFEELYANDDARVKALLGAFVAKRSDAELKSTIISIFNYSQNFSDSKKFLQDSLNFYTEQGFEDVFNRLIGEYCQIFEGLRLSLMDLAERATECAIDSNADYFNYVASQLELMSQSRTPSQILSIYNDILFKRPNIKTDDKTEKVEQFIADYNHLRDKKLAKFMDDFAKTFSAGKDALLRDTLDCYPLVENVINVVNLFAEKFAQLKAELGVLDYNDLEHYALKVLSNNEICAEVAQRYKYIFVDEYQDTNGVQETIFSLIERNNLFIVGDLKQSIYAFRGCNPSIFLHRINACKNSENVHVNLDKNYRSAPNVIKAVNNVFCGVMTSQLSGIDYASNPMISCDNYGENLGEAFLHVLPKTEREKTEISGVYSIKKHLENLRVSSRMGEEMLIADIIEQELGFVDGTPKTFFDVKTKTVKDVSFGDITVLTRKNQGLSDRIVAELIKRSIPVANESRRSIAEYPEIKLMMGLLEHIVNPVSDIPLATVLSSAVGGFSANELAKIRSAKQRCSFYDVAKFYAQTQTDLLAKKLAEFFAYFEKIRLIAQFDTASKVLKKVVVERGLEVDVLSGKLGKVKLSRINRFISVGENMSAFEMHQKIDVLLKPISVSEVANGNAVRVLSQHSSKGLEYPIVILAETSAPFSSESSKPKILVDRYFGLGVKKYDRNNMTATDTLLRKYIKFKLSQEQVVDEMRLFYVALTRAKYRLHVITKNRLSQTHRFERFALASRMDEFLAVSDFCIAPEWQPLQKQEKLRRVAILGNPDSAEVEKISKYLNFEYKFAGDTTLHLKRSVTSATKDAELSVNQDEKTVDIPALFNYQPMEVGTAYHRFLEGCNFNGNAVEQFEKMLESRFLTADQASLLSVDKLENLLKMDIFKKISGCKLFREQPFIVNAPCSLLGLNGTENVLLQGIIDLLAVDGENAFIIDYKYSVKSDQNLLQTYKKQVELYAYAVEKVLHYKIKGKYLVNLNKLSVIEV